MTHIILLSLSVVFLIIGVHQSFFFGIQNSYWAFMLSGGSFLWLQLRKKQQAEGEKKAAQGKSKQQIRKRAANSKRAKRK